MGLQTGSVIVKLLSLTAIQNTHNNITDNRL